MLINIFLLQGESRSYSICFYFRGDNQNFTQNWLEEQSCIGPKTSMSNNCNLNFSMLHLTEVHSKMSLRVKSVVSGKIFCFYECIQILKCFPSM